MGDSSSRLQQGNDRPHNSKRRQAQYKRKVHSREDAKFCSPRLSLNSTFDCAWCCDEVKRP